MKTISTASIGLTIAALLGLAGVLVQARSLGDLRATQRQLADQTAPAAAATAVEALPTRAPAPPTLTGLSEADRIRLMQLRSQVTDLRERQRGLGAISNEHARLQERFLTVSNLASGRAAPGWVRRRDARMAGFGTPQAAFETFVWAVEHRDTNTLNLVAPGIGAFVLSSEEGAEGRLNEFWNEVTKQLPGFRIRSTSDEPGGDVRMELEFAPGVGGPTVQAHKVNGRWTVSM